jgi:formylglycine-generating enzyme required for sulfatase activity
MNTTCPSESVLNNFAQGHCADSELDLVTAHVAECPICEQRLQQFENAADDLCTSIRRAAARNDDDDELECLVAKAAVSLLPALAIRREYSDQVNGIATFSRPSRIAQYELGDRIGRGGMGEVYKAVHTSLKRPVAIKFIAGHRLNDPAAVLRFHREMEAVGNLDHPNIVRAHDAGEHDGHHFLVMEFVDGRNLGQVVHDDGPLSVGDACEICRQAALGLDCAHRHGLVHRDVKPSNLVLTTDGVVKVLDLGLARFGRENDDADQGPDTLAPRSTAIEADASALTRDGQVMGSPGFVAPEQVYASQAVDHRVDIFSLGATLFYLLTATRPFPCVEGERSLQAIRADEVEQLLTKLPANVPSELRQWIRRMMSPVASERPQSMSEVARMLSKFSHNAKRPVIANRSWRKFGVVMIAVVLAALAILAVTSAYQQRDAITRSVVQQNEQPDSTPDVVLSTSSEAESLITNSIGMNLALIPAGEFLMGSPVDEAKREDVEGPQHRVQITQAFYMGVYEVTQAEYQRVMKRNPSFYSHTGGGKSWVRGLDTDRFPVESVSWQDATAFCAALSALPEEANAGRKYRLPTEAEWEYACRAGTTSPFHYGSSLSSSQANFKGSIPYGVAAKGRFIGHPTPVGSYQPNAFGLFDMHGNVWEWCQDWYGPDYYASSPADDPRGPTSGSRHVMRGGGWGVSAMLCRSAHRNSKVEPIAYLYSSGFRVVMEMNQVFNCDL